MCHPYPGESPIQFRFRLAINPSLCGCVVVVVIITLAPTTATASSPAALQHSSTRISTSFNLIAVMLENVKDL